MEHPEVHGRPRAEGRPSPIFVPVVKGTHKLVRRGHRRRRQMQMVGVGVIVLLLAAFSYAFVVEREREQTLKAETR